MNDESVPISDRQVSAVFLENFSPSIAHGKAQISGDLTIVFKSPSGEPDGPRIELTVALFAPTDVPLDEAYRKYFQKAHALLLRAAQESAESLQKQMIVSLKKALANLPQ